MADNYMITGQSQSTELNPAGGGFINVWQVKYKVTAGPATGTLGMVQVPEDQHNAATVKAMIEAKIKDLTEVASLGG